MTRHMLTTVDNPFNPFTEFTEWYRFDTSAGYHTTNYLARIVVTSEDLSETDQDLAYEAAVDEIVLYNVNGMYRKVAEPQQAA